MKNYMKRALCILLAGLLCISVLTGCGNEKTQPEIIASEFAESNEAIPALAEEPVATPVPSPSPTPQFLTQKQQDSINMLNYLTVLVQEIRKAKNNRVYLESAYSELINNTEPNVVDDLTLDEYEKILSTINNYRLTAVKRERLQYIYQQNNAHAIRSVIPNPLALLNFATSTNPLRAIASVAYMAVNSYNSYSSYTQELDLQYLKDGWELDDAEADNLHNSRSGMFAYMSRVANQQHLPEGYTLNEEAVTDFVSRVADPNAASRIRWLESHQKTYSHFGEYWLALAKSYCESGDYEKCLGAISTYESLGIHIFRVDIRLAQTLPDAIVAAREALSTEAYVAEAARYADLIMRNTNSKDWSLRYFAAQTYIDLYAKTHSREYLRMAYEIILDNVTELKPVQLSLNKAYLSPVVEASVDKNASKEDQKAAKAYNEALNNEREVALPPVYEPLRLNCDLLVALANELELSSDERKAADDILHGSDSALFLSIPMANKFTLSDEAKSDFSLAEISYNVNVLGTHELKIPAAYLAEGSVVEVVVKQGSNRTTLTKWYISEVDRAKSNDIGVFIATYECKPEKKIDIKDGDTLEVKIYLPGTEGQDSRESDAVVYLLNAVKKTTLMGPHIEFKRADK